MIKKLTAVLAIIIGLTGLGSGLFAADVYADTALPVLQGEAAILMDGNSGKILYTKNEHSQLEPASTTKMITCLLAIENLDLNQVITIDEETSFTEGSRIYLLEGERVTVEQLLYALMTVSANDAAVALAKAVAGNTETFAAMMNERAKELGALNTNFVNPHGLHAEGHVSTAYDLAMIAKGCMENETFRKLCSTYKYYIPATNKQDERYLYNTNRLIYDTVNQVPVNGVNRTAFYEGAIGVKTGLTPEAGGCLASAAKRDGTYFIATVMKSTDSGRFGDCIALLDYGYANYYGVEVADAKTTDLGTAPVKHGTVREVGLELAGSVYITLPIEASKDVLKTELVLDEEIKAPITTGQALGVYNVYEGDNLIATTAAIASTSVGNGTFLSVFGIENSTAYVIFWVAGILITLILALVITYIVLKRRKIRRRKERRAKRAMEIAKARAERERDIEKRNWHF